MPYHIRPRHTAPYHSAPYYIAPHHTTPTCMSTALTIHTTSIPHRMHNGRLSRGMSLRTISQLYVGTTPRQTSHHATHQHTVHNPPFPRNHSIPKSTPCSTWQLTLEDAVEYIVPGEFVEVTPGAIRMGKHTKNSRSAKK